MMDSTDPWLLHFTHLDNLPEIVCSGLLADNRRRPDVRECGQPSIKERRRHRLVPMPPGGVVADYAPFYFAPRSPMLRSILGGQVQQYDGDQTDLIYLLTRLSQVIDAGLRWVATDRNAVLRPARFTGQAAELADHIDWDVMNARQWANTETDGSRKERRMAELLVHELVPWRLFSHLAACCAERAEQATALLGGASPAPKALVRPHWYFDVPGSCPCQGVLNRGGGALNDR